MFPTFIAILGNPVARLILIAALASGAGFSSGWRVRGAFDDQASASARIAEAQRVAAKANARVRLMSRQATATAAVDAAHNGAQEKIRTVYKTIEKEVRVYDPAKDDACYSRALPDRFVGLWNSASAGLPPVAQPASGSAPPGGKTRPAPR